MENFASIVVQETRMLLFLLLKRRNGELLMQFPVGSLLHHYRCQLFPISSSYHKFYGYDTFYSL